MDAYKKTFIVTGANTGLGYYCAKNIAFEDPSNHLILACRDEQKAKIAVAELIAETGNTNIHFLHLDLSSFQSVREFSSSFIQKKFPPLKGIVCNAGLAGEDTLTFTNDGIETTFQVNCLGHFLLIQLLFKHLESPSRILMVSSELHRNDGPMKAFLPNYTNAKDLAHPDPDKANVKGSGQIRYSTSKLCMLLYTHSFFEKLNTQGMKDISINAYNPGLMPDTSLGGLNKKLFRKLFLKYILPLFIKSEMGTPQKSGKILADLVLAEKYKGVTGKYFDRDKEVAPSKESFDKNKMEDLWRTSIELTNCENAL